MRRKIWDQGDDDEDDDDDDDTIGVGGRGKRTNLVLVLDSPPPPPPICMIYGFLYSLLHPPSSGPPKIEKPSPFR